MIDGLVIMLREGLEAALIVGIILAFLHRIEQIRYSRYIWFGVVVAITASVVIALLFSVLYGGLEGTTEELFEGVMMFLAVVVLTYMILWMRIQARNIAGGLRESVIELISDRRVWGLALLAFIAVFREGVESVLFLGAAAISSPDVLLGAAIGICISIGLAYLLFTTTKNLNISKFFAITGVLLIIFAAGMFAYGIHEFQEAGVLPIYVEYVWDTSSILSDDGFPGVILKGLMGYNANPSLLEVVGYIAYWVILAGIYILWKPELRDNGEQGAEKVKNLVKPKLNVNDKP